MSVASQQQIQILHVDDEPEFGDLTATFLERDSDRFAVETATSADEGLQFVHERSPDCVVSDYNMPGMDGIEFLRAIRKEYPDLPFILFTGKGSEAVAGDAISAGVTDYLQKGSGSERYELLANRIRNAVQGRRRAQQAEQQEELMRLTEFVGDTGGFEINLETDEVLLTDGCASLTGLSTDPDIGLDDAIEMYHPDDRKELREAIDRTRRTGKQTQGVWRYQSPDGEQRLFELRFDVTSTNGDTTLVRGAINDVTEQNRREQQLAQQNEQLEAKRQFIQQALDGLKDLFYVTDGDGALRRWNEQVPEVTGYTESELDDMQAVGLFSEDDRETIATAIETALSGQDTTVEATVHTADGQRIPYEIKVTQLTDEAEVTTGVVGIGRDLTERRRQQRRMKALVEESNDIISIISQEGQFQYNSPSVERIMGYEPAEMHGDMAWAYIHPDDRERAKAEFADWVESAERTKTIRYRARHADGSWRWIEARWHDQLDSPTVDGYVVNSRDITDRREREREVRRLKQQYETLAENYPNGAVYLVDEDLRYVRARGEELEAAELTSDEVEGATPHEVLPADVAERLCQHYEQAFAGQQNTFEQAYRGEQYQVRTVPVWNGGDEVERVISVAQNISEYATREQELERQNERLEEFASIVSHDLRNPLTVAEGHLDLAMEDSGNDHLDSVADAIDRCQTLVDDLLVLAQEGQEATEVEPVELAQLAEHCWQDIESETATLETDLTGRIRAERSRVTQLLVNLYQNAIDHGGDDVTVHVGEIADGFYVADTGSGIPESERDEIFDAGYSTTEDGTGFGLRIVEQVADVHGWEVTVTDSTQGGARFEITGVDSVER